ncbi:MAG: hypothetical protein L6Q76_04430 [Polyangiaceae bacterium]|nr:hypothetical protein [Polyangiaceae bacterium]
MQTDDKLPPELTWESDGHLTEVALTMLADGEAALLDAGTAPHVAGCEACSARLGAAALMALRVGEELPLMAARASLETAATVVSPAMNAVPAQAAISSRAVPTGVRALPLRAIAAALVVAAVGSLPSFIAGADELPELLMTLIQGLVMIGRTVAGVAEGSARGALLVAPALSWLSAGLLVLSGLAVARAMSRRRVLQEGGM